MKATTTQLLQAVQSVAKSSSRLGSVTMSVSAVRKHLETVIKCDAPSASDIQASIDTFTSELTHASVEKYAFEAISTRTATADRDGKIVVMTTTKASHGAAKALLQIAHRLKKWVANIANDGKVSHITKAALVEEYARIPKAKRHDAAIARVIGIGDGATVAQSVARGAFGLSLVNRVLTDTAAMDEVIAAAKERYAKRLVVSATDTAKAKAKASTVKPAGKRVAPVIPTAATVLAGVPGTVEKPVQMVDKLVNAMEAAKAVEAGKK